jgi:RNA polymerase sigma-70 factor (ECF subfamily)
MFRFLVVSEDAKTVTRLLRAWQDGDETALDSLMPLIYTELHKIARRFMQQERAGHTLRPTALVSEAYLRLVEKEPPAANNRVHFFAIAAQIMRQILVDSARSRCASKRGGGQRPLTLDETIAAVDRPEELVALDEALIALSKHYPRKAQAIELCYFGGLTHDEIALKLDVHPNTVARDLRLGEALLRTYLTAEGD